MSPAQVDAFLNALRQTFSALEELPIPTIAAIDGPALGGGLELALACDLRVAGERILVTTESQAKALAGPGASQIGLTETRIGIIPGAGGTQRLTRLLGLSRAKSLIFAAKVLTAQQAHELGGPSDPFCGCLLIEGGQASSTP